MEAIEIKSADIVTEHRRQMIAKALETVLVLKELPCTSHVLASVLQVVNFCFPTRWQVPFCEATGYSKKILQGLQSGNIEISDEVRLGLVGVAERYIRQRMALFEESGLDERD